MGSDKKRLQISSSFDFESKHIHEKITNNTTGETRTVDSDEPHQSQRSVTITSDPVKYEVKGGEEPKVVEGEAVQVNPATIGFDTSQL